MPIDNWASTGGANSAHVFFLLDGGMLPPLATAIVAWSGNIYYGLWYPIIVSLMTFFIGVPLMHETRHIRIHEEH